MNYCPNFAKRSVLSSIASKMAKEKTALKTIFIKGFSLPRLLLCLVQSIFQRRNFAYPPSHCALLGCQNQITGISSQTVCCGHCTAVHSSVRCCKTMMLIEKMQSRSGW